MDNLIRVQRFPRYNAAFYHSPPQGRIHRPEKKTVNGAVGMHCGRLILSPLAKGLPTVPWATVLFCGCDAGWLADMTCGQTRGVQGLVAQAGRPHVCKRATATMQHEARAQAWWDNQAPLVLCEAAQRCSKLCTWARESG